jgi:ATP-dependent Clp protease protease subunit
MKFSRDKDKEKNKNDEDEDDCENDESNITRENNHIYFYSEIDRNTIFKLNSFIREAEEYCILNSYKLNIDIPIYLHINSNGGTISDAYAAIDVITSSRIPIYSIIEGATASAGTLLSVVCKKRYIRPNAYMLIHQLNSELWGKMSEIEDEYKNLQETMKKLIKLYVKNSNILKKDLKKMLKHDLWLNSGKCIEYGLVDELWK